MSTSFKCCLCGSTEYKTIFSPKHIIECQQCGLRSVFNPKSESIEYTDLYYDTFNGSDSDLKKMWGKRLKVVLDYTKSGRLLDIGSGTGIFLSLAKKYFAGEGTEISDYASKRAKKTYDVKVLKGSLDDVKKDDYDIVTLWHVLEHFDNPDKAITKISQLLKDKGMFFLALPNDDSLKQKIKKLLNYKSLYFDAPPSRENHLYFFTPTTLAKLLKKHGFEILKLKADDYYGERMTISNLKFKISNFFTQTIPLALATNILVVARKV